MDIADKRDNAQKLQAQQVSAKDARAADAMEKSRLQKEKAALAPADTVFIDEPSAASPVKQAKPKTPEKFVAQGPGLKTAKPALKKKAKKKKTTPS